MPRSTSGGWPTAPMAGSSSPPTSTTPSRSATPTTGRLLLTLPEPNAAHGMSVVDARFSPDGTRVAACVAAGASRWVTLWDATTGRVTGQLKGHTSHVINVVFSPDGRRLATASHDRTAKVWDAESCRELWSLGAQADRINGVAFSPDGASARHRQPGRNGGALGRCHRPRSDDPAGPPGVRRHGGIQPRRPPPGVGGGPALGPGRGPAR